jgi:phage terminase large subunit GpA-like protein
VSGHKRLDYHFGKVPNGFAAKHCGGPVLLLTCTVDVHKDNLAVSVFGWCRDRRAILIDYWRFEGDTEQLDNAPTWGRLRTLIENPELYTADDGKKYRIAITLIDSGYRSDDVYRFANEYESSVYPVKGRDAPAKSATLKEFSEFTTPMGARAFAITVDFYKDRWSAALRRSWDGVSLQPQGHFNAPLDASEAQLKELTVEQKKEQLEPGTQNRIGWKWVRPSGAPNELWDLLVYANAGLDLLAWEICRGQLEMEFVNWQAFYDMCLEQRLFFVEPPNG